MNYIWEGSGILSIAEEGGSKEEQQPFGIQ